METTWSIPLKIANDDVISCDWEIFLLVLCVKRMHAENRRCFKATPYRAVSCNFYFCSDNVSVLLGPAYKENRYTHTVP